jgi:hypothetical protein
MNLSFRRFFIYLFFVIGIGVGLYKYGVQRIYHPYSQWDLKTHIAAVQRDIGDKPGFDADFVQRAYLPPFLPIGYPLFHLLGNIDWRITKFAWLALSSVLIILMVYLTSRQIKEFDTNFNRNHLGLMLLLVFFFKGTFLGLAAGQISVLVIFFLVLSVHFQNRNEILAMLLLALASFKPNLAAPFFLYLLVKQNYRLFLLSTAATLLLNIGITFAYLGPTGHLNLLWDSLQKFGTVGQNSYLLMGQSGRVDLAPFLAVFGIEGVDLHIIQGLIFLLGLIVIIVYRKRMGNRLLQMNCIALFYTIFYYRDYDVLLLLLIALPLIWLHRHKFQWWHILLFFPAVLPIQRIYETGVNVFPAGEIIFDLIGTSMIVSVGSLAILLNNFRQRLERDASFSV